MNRLKLVLTLLAASVISFSCQKDYVSLEQESRFKNEEHFLKEMQIMYEEVIEKQIKTIEKSNIAEFEKLCEWSERDYFASPDAVHYSVHYNPNNGKYYLITIYTTWYGYGDSASDWQELSPQGASYYCN